MENRIRKAKIVATIGPASSDATTLKKLIEVGANIFRFNLKYSTPEEHGRIIDEIRRLAQKQAKHVDILIDLPSFSFSEGIKLASEKKVEYVALSYIKKEDEVISFKKEAEKTKLFARVVVKIETTHSLGNFNAILNEADAFMVARGDLGKSIQVEKVPFAQKEIILACKESGKMVIVATEMLLSMVKSKIPTRAEVSDVANAVLEGSDAVMLSEETSIGENPVEAVEIMSKIIKEAESWQELGHLHVFPDENTKFKFG